MTDPDFDPLLKPTNLGISTPVVSDDHKTGTALLESLQACAQSAGSRTTSPADRLAYAQAADYIASALRTFRESAG